eukprot:2679747-Amphidinium_carterae.1
MERAKLTKATTTTTMANRTVMEKGKTKDGGKPKGPPVPSNDSDYWKGKNGGRGKGDKNIICYYCGKPGHTSDKCWWNKKGQ